jgi:hypothetical protein
MAGQIPELSWIPPQEQQIWKGELRFAKKTNYKI